MNIHEILIKHILFVLLIKFKHLTALHIDVFRGFVIFWQFYLINIDVIEILIKHILFVSFTYSLVYHLQLYLLFTNLLTTHYGLAFKTGSIPLQKKILWFAEKNWFSGVKIFFFQIRLKNLMGYYSLLFYGLAVKDREYSFS